MGLNDRVTSSSLARTTPQFPLMKFLFVMAIVVWSPQPSFIECDAAHIIPLRKGNEVLFRMLL